MCYENILRFGYSEFLVAKATIATESMSNWPVPRLSAKREFCSTLMKAWEKRHARSSHAIDRLGERLNKCAVRIAVGRPVSNETPENHTGHQDGNEAAARFD
jgi:hypothetical protein